MYYAIRDGDDNPDGTIIISLFGEEQVYQLENMELK